MLRVFDTCDAIRIPSLDIAVIEAISVPLCTVTEEFVGLMSQTTILELGVTIARATVALILL